MNSVFQLSMTLVLTSLASTAGHEVIIEEQFSIDRRNTINMRNNAIQFNETAHRHFFSEFLYENDFILVGSSIPSIRMSWTELLKLSDFRFIIGDKGLYLSYTQRTECHFEHKSADFATQPDRKLYTATLIMFSHGLHRDLSKQKLEWLSEKMDTERCFFKHKSQNDCENYIRVITKLQSNEYLICGTNSYNPLCRTYVRNKFGRFEFTNQESGTARCPFGPTDNSTTHYSDGRLYTATTADWSSRDSIIYSQPLRTEQHNSQWLNDAQFVGAFDFGDKVYFFFREMAIEQINCGKVILSRVAQVCKRDVGGSRVLRQTWTSFFKARLNCSIPGAFPYYLDEIQSVTELGRGNILPSISKVNRTQMVYAVFTTPTNSIRGSAICAFKLSEIIKTFEGPFKEQKTPQSNWLPVPEKDNPQPHPAIVCLNDSLQLPDQTLNFIKTHPLMDQSVPAFGGQPVLVHAGFQSVFTAIAVDWQVLTWDHKRYDVIFIGTEDGRVLKVINRAVSDQQMEPLVIEEIKVFDEHVIHMKIYMLHESNSTTTTLPRSTVKSLLVASSTSMTSVPLQRCGNKTTCRDCVALRDPYCSWLHGRCVQSSKGYQNIESGTHPKCVTITSSHTLHDDVITDNNNDGNNNNNNELIDSHPTDDVTVSSPNISSQISGPCYTVSWRGVVDTLYTTEAMALATTVCSLVSLTVGCTLGYSVATYRRSTVSDVERRRASQHIHNWTDSNPTIVSHHVTKSQLIAVLNERNTTDCNIARELLTSSSRQTQTVQY